MVLGILIVRDLRLLRSGQRAIHSSIFPLCVVCRYMYCPTSKNYHIYPQWLHLKLLPILPDASPKKDTDIARSSASIFFRSVLPQVGQRGALACSAARRAAACSLCLSISAHFIAAFLLAAFCCSFSCWMRL